MAKTQSQAATFLYLALLLSLLVTNSYGFKQSAPICLKAYEVKDGDKCGDLGETFKLSAGKFFDLNPNLVCEKLFIGQWICSSDGFKQSEPICLKAYEVKDGDKCGDLGETFKLSAGKFFDLNPNLVCEKLFIGQWLCIQGTV